MRRVGRMIRASAGRSCLGLQHQAARRTTRRRGRSSVVGRAQQHSPIGFGRCHDRPPGSPPSHEPSGWEDRGGEYDSSAPHDLGQRHGLGSRAQAARLEPDPVAQVDGAESIWSGGPAVRGESAPGASAARCGPGPAAERAAARCLLRADVLRRSSSRGSGRPSLPIA